MNLKNTQYSQIQIHKKIQIHKYKFTKKIQIHNIPKCAGFRGINVNIFLKE